MINKFFKSICLMVLPLSLNFTKVFSLDANMQVNRDENKIILSTSFENSDDYNKNVGKDSYIEIDYDGSVLKYENVNLPENETFLKRRDFKIEKEANKIKILKRANGKEKNSKMSQRINFEFKIKDVLHSSTANITAKTKATTGSDEKVFFSGEAKIPENPKISTCKLKSLSADCGNLSPSFSPDIQKYDINVNYDVSEINFNFEPFRDDLLVKINRSKLNAPGKATEIFIEVTDKELKSYKKVYEISVKREQKSKEETSYANNLNNSYSASKNSKNKTLKNNVKAENGVKKDRNKKFLKKENKCLKEPLKNDNFVKYDNKSNHENEQTIPEKTKGNKCPEELLKNDSFIEQEPEELLDEDNIDSVENDDNNLPCSNNSEDDFCDFEENSPKNLDEKTDLKEKPSNVNVVSNDEDKSFNINDEFVNKIFIVIFIVILIGSVAAVLFKKHKSKHNN